MIHNALREAVVRAANAVRELLVAARLPAPVNDARCRHCSLIDLCQPGAVADRDRYQRLLDDLRA